MDDLPPPVQLTPDVPSPAGPANFSNPSFIKKAFKFIIKIKWTKVSLYIISFIGVVNLVINIPAVKNVIEANFPHSSPVFAREVIMQGVLKNSSLGLHTIVLPNQDTYTLHFKPSVSLTNLKKVNEALVKGKLTWTPFVIEEAEIYPLNFTTDDSNLSTPTTSIFQTDANSSTPSSLPDLYSGLKWETSQKKVLIFTSGKRKIEQEGVYLESAQVSAFPQDFINYYLEKLKNQGFKETLNSINPDGITVTYSSGDLFLTFGVKNVYKGSSDNKQLTGYKAYLEHN